MKYRLSRLWSKMLVLLHYYKHRYNIKDYNVLQTQREDGLMVIDISRSRSEQENYARILYKLCYLRMKCRPACNPVLKHAKSMPVGVWQLRDYTMLPQPLWHHQEIALVWSSLYSELRMINFVVDWISWFGGYTFQIAGSNDERPLGYG